MYHLPIRLLQGAVTIRYQKVKSVRYNASGSEAFHILRDLGLSVWTLEEHELLVTVLKIVCQLSDLFITKFQSDRAPPTPYSALPAA